MSLITPRSIVVDAADEGYVGTFVGSTNTAREEGLVVLASFAADVVFHLRFDMPPTLPSGTGKLRLRPTAAATSGNLQINPKWLSVAGGESADPAAGSYNAEGTTTITWGAGDSEDQLPETLITLDADTLVANETVYMLLVFESASTLAVDGFIRVDIKFE